MQVDVPQIQWHDDCASIMSIDFYPNSNYFVTASYYQDEDTGLRFWEFVQVSNQQQTNNQNQEQNSNCKRWQPEYRYDLQGGHTSTINVVRFSPNGQYLASGSDDQMVILWTLKLVPAEFGKLEEVVQWGHPRQLRGHVGDVMDLCWSNDSNHLVSGSLDGTAILWSIGGNKFSRLQQFDGHKKYVQGVSFDSLMKYIVTMSSDSTIRTLKNREEEQENNEEAPMEIDQQQEILQDQPSAVSESKKKCSHRMFLDDIEYQSFFRRLSWSPDGSFMLTPASVHSDFSCDSKNSYVVYGFIKTDLTQPAFMLPGIKTYATCLRFNPYLYQRKIKEPEEEKPLLFDLPYRVIFAIGTVDQVLIYSTESIYPIAIIGNIHYAPINDMTWESNRKLVISSSDGYISVISFDENEDNLIGQRLQNSEVPDKLREFYQNLDQVSYSRSENEVREGKKNQFKSVAFKSKVNNNQQRTSIINTSETEQIKT